MSPKKRNQLRQQYLARGRQANLRKARKKRGFKELQVRISRYAHHKASLVAAEQGVPLTKIYELAITNANLEQLPRHHLEVVEGDLIGYVPISPWIESKVHQRFYDDILVKYPKSRMAISAIVNDYCERACE